jgi:Zn-finger nucleic acid-binding protein
MYRCPLCRIDLEPADYEGQRLHSCPQCHGHMVEHERLELITRLRNHSWKALKAEAAAGFSGSTVPKLLCPRCRRRMTRRMVYQPLRLGLDLCADCALVWLDAGELALVQLLYEASPSGQVTAELMNRVRELEADPARLARFEESLAHLPAEIPDGPDSAGDGELAEAVERLVVDLALRLLGRGVKL